MIQTYYLFDIGVVCIYLKGVSRLFVRFFLTFDKRYRQLQKLNKTKLRFIKVTYPWSLPMTEMALKITKSKRFCAIKGDNVILSIGAPLQTLGAPNTPLWIVHSVTI